MPRLYIKILTVAPGVSEFSEISEISEYPEFSENSDNSKSSEIKKRVDTEAPTHSIVYVIANYLTNTFCTLTLPLERTDLTMLMPLTGADTLAPPRV